MLMQPCKGEGAYSRPAQASLVPEASLNAVFPVRVDMSHCERRGIREISVSKCGAVSV